MFYDVCICVMNLLNKFSVVWQQYCLKFFLKSYKWYQILYNVLKWMYICFVLFIGILINIYIQDFIWNFYSYVFVDNVNYMCFRFRFLRGICFIVDCLFFYKVDKEKMFVCLYFLRGVCSRENCSYFYVKVNKNVEVCQDFLQGFCLKGVKVQCDMVWYVCTRY